VEEEIKRWRAYRKALRKKDQAVFDELMVSARKHSSASGYHVTTNPFETMVMSILIELKKEMNDVKKRLEPLD
jgi:hypothetical protein